MLENVNMRPPRPNDLGSRIAPPMSTMPFLAELLVAILTTHSALAASIAFSTFSSITVVVFILSAGIPRCAAAIRWSGEMNLLTMCNPTFLRGMDGATTKHTDCLPQLHLCPLFGAESQAEEPIIG